MDFGWLASFIEYITLGKRNLFFTQDLTTLKMQFVMSVYCVNSGNVRSLKCKKRERAYKSMLRNEKSLEMNVSRVAATQKHAGCEEESSRVIAPSHPTLLSACRTARPQRDTESEGNWQEQQKKEWDEVLVECKSQNTTPGKRCCWWWSGSCVGVCVVAPVVVVVVG